MFAYRQIIITDDQVGQRIDKVVAQNTGISRTRIQELIQTGQVTVNGCIIMDNNYKVSAQDMLLLYIPQAKVSTLVPNRQINFEVLFEDEQLLVINKPAGLVVHPGAGTDDNTLVHGLLEYCGNSLSGIGGVLRPGIVHRLDENTSGLMVVAKNDQAHQILSEQLALRTMSRVYQAIVWQVPANSVGVISTQIGRSKRNRQKMAVLHTGGKLAITHYKVLEILDARKASLIECRLQTGRTHQIRVHLSHLGHSLIGDPVYGHNTRKLISNNLTDDSLVANFPRQALHAKTLSFTHPNGQSMLFTSELPGDMQSLLANLRLNNK